MTLRPAWLILALIVLVSASWAEAGTAQTLTIKPSGSYEVVHRELGQACKLRLYPDLPARAVRSADGTLHLFVTFEDNWYLAGRDWGDLRAVCASALMSHENPDPYAFDDKVWLQALFSEDGRTFFGLGSHEYAGARHPGRCDTPMMPSQAPACWYSSILQYRAAIQPIAFQPIPSAKLVAVPQVPFDRASTKRVGFLTTSNVVASDEHWYTFIYGEGAAGQPGGSCLFRADEQAALPHWLAWNGKAFAVELDQPVSRSPADPAKQASCMPIFPGQVRGLVRQRRTGTWIAIFQARDPDPAIGEGIFYATSGDLLSWSPLRQLMKVNLNYVPGACPDVYRYPSIIDHDAPGFNFDTVGESAFLYMVRIPFDHCKATGREVVRLTISIR